MSHPSIYSYTFIVPQNVIDEYGHVNNVAYVQWMQDVAIRHGEAAGYNYPENAGWFAREHRIQYLLPAFLGEEIEARTWVTEYKRVRLHRNYEFTRTSDGKVIARGETDWVFVDITTGRPMSIPKEIQIMFPAVLERPDSAASI